MVEIGATDDDDEPLVDRVYSPVRRREKARITQIANRRGLDRARLCREWILAGLAADEEIEQQAGRD